MTPSHRQAVPQPVVALPVPAPVPTHQGPGALADDIPEDPAVAPAPGVFPVRHLVGVVVEVLRSKLADLADLATAEAREVRFREVVGRAIIGAVGLPWFTRRTSYLAGSRS